MGTHTMPLRIYCEAGSVVMIAEDEFEGWKETIHLLSSPTALRHGHAGFPHLRRDEHGDDGHDRIYLWAAREVR
jgi:PHD/YefM family antitoxin component YafN of YafNO toxin-antitoxin module